MQRMFMLTPKIVMEPGSVAESAPAKPAAMPTAPIATPIVLAPAPSGSTGAAETPVPAGNARSPPVESPLPEIAEKPNAGSPAAVAPIPDAKPAYAEPDPATAHAIFGFAETGSIVKAVSYRERGEFAAVSAADGCPPARKVLNLCDAKDRATTDPVLWAVPASVPSPNAAGPWTNKPPVPVSPAPPRSSTTGPSTSEEAGKWAKEPAFKVSNVAESSAENPSTRRPPGTHAAVSRAVKAQCPAAAVVLGTCVAKTEN